MDNKFEQDNKIIKEILTPKHTPECKIEFTNDKKARRTVKSLFIRIASVAAVLAILLFFSTKINVVEETHAASVTTEMIDRAIEKLSDKKSLYVELKTYGRAGEKSTDGKIYFFKEESIIYMRAEWDDPNNTVAITGKDSIQLWRNGILKNNMKIPFRPVMYETIFDMLPNILKKIGGMSYILNELNSIPTHEPDSTLGDMPLYSIPAGAVESVKVSKEKQTITIETQPAAKYHPFYILEFSAEKEEFTNIKIVMEDKKTSQKRVWTEITKIAYGYPITLNDIMRRPE